jgi:hypothetical protein
MKDEGGRMKGKDEGGRMKGKDEGGRMKDEECSSSSGGVYRIVESHEVLGAGFEVRVKRMDDKRFCYRSSYLGPRPCTQRINAAC